MARYRSSGEDRTPRLAITVATAVVAVSVAAAVISDMAERKDEIRASTADLSLANITGPPCLTAARGVYAEPLTPDKTFYFNDVHFARKFGFVECGVAAAKDPLGQGFHSVCQFSSPAVLAVRTPRGMSYFEPGVGRAATVLVQNGVARCVLTSPYWAAYMHAVTDTDAKGKLLPIKAGGSPHS